MPRVKLSTVERLAEASHKNRSLLCVGLDPDLALTPEPLRGAADPLLAFNRAIIEATADLACAYKPNLAFYEVHGAAGWETLERTLAAIPPEIPIILDAKRGDVGNTARMYAEALFDRLGGDAVTVNPYMGRDAVAPFLAYGDRLTFLLAATSNPGAAELQDRVGEDGLPLYLKVARMARECHGQPGAVGLVAGATTPDKLAALRAEAPDLWLLVPGVGAQGGDLETCMRLGLAGSEGRMLINASRTILYASSGADFAEAARRSAMELRDAINRHRPVAE